MKYVILENIRSAYNVGNIIRTADALWWQVIVSWFTPSPFEHDRVRKTSLGAENHVGLQQFWHAKEAISFVKWQHAFLVAAEYMPEMSCSIDTVTNDYWSIALLLWNEKTGVLQESLTQVDVIAHIPMQGFKASLNVGQAWAIAMWELWKE